MSTEAEQASFEAQLSHLERLNNSRYRTSDFDFKIYKSLVDEIVQNLAKYCVYVNESTAIKDIERLTALRFFVPRKAVFSGSSFAGQTCIDPIIDAKIGHLRNSKASMKDLDPVNSLQRLGIIKTCLANAPSGYHTFGAELTVIIQQRSLDLGERIASSKVTTKSLSDVKVDSTIEGLLTRNTEIASQVSLYLLFPPEPDTDNSSRPPMAQSSGLPYYLFCFIKSAEKEKKYSIPPHNDSSNADGLSTQRKPWTSRMKMKCSRRSLQRT